MSSQRARIIGYACGLVTGAIWGTTGPLSTALYAEGAAISAVGFWRLLLAILGLTIYGFFAPGQTLSGGVGGRLGRREMLAYCTFIGPRAR